MAISPSCVEHIIAPLMGLLIANGDGAQVSLRWLSIATGATSTNPDFRHGIPRAFVLSSGMKISATFVAVQLEDSPRVERSFLGDPGTLPSWLWAKMSMLHLYWSSSEC